MMNDILTLKFLIEEIFKPYYEGITKKFNDTPICKKVLEISEINLENFKTNKIINPAINLFRELLEEALIVRK